MSAVCLSDVSGAHPLGKPDGREGEEKHHYDIEAQHVDQHHEQGAVVVVIGNSDAIGGRGLATTRLYDRQTLVRLHLNKEHYISWFYNNVCSKVYINIIILCSYTKPRFKLCVY